MTSSATPTTTPEGALDITDRLREMRGALHVNELRHSGTADGNLYAKWGAVAAFALIEIERLRAPMRHHEGLSPRPDLHPRQRGRRKPASCRMGFPLDDKGPLLELPFPPSH